MGIHKHVIKMWSRREENPILVFDFLAFRVQSSFSQFILKDYRVRSSHTALRSIREGLARGKM